MAAPGNYFDTFDTLDLPPLGTGLAWDTSGLLVDGTIKVVGPTLNFVNNGNSLDFSWTGTFKLQAQTNSLSVGIANNWGDYPGGGSSPVTVSVIPAMESFWGKLKTELVYRHHFATRQQARGLASIWWTAFG